MDSILLTSHVFYEKDRIFEVSRQQIFNIRFKIK